MKKYTYISQTKFKNHLFVRYVTYRFRARCKFLSWFKSLRAHYAHAYKHPRDFLSPDIGYVHTASNEATKSTFLLFNGLLMTGLYKPYSGWEEGTSAKNLLLVWLKTRLLVSILLENCFKISGSNLVPVSNYWNWIKTIPSKKSIFLVNFS